MGELSFLIELLLNHKLAKPTKDLISARIKELEERMVSQPIVHQAQPMSAVNQPRQSQPTQQRALSPSHIIAPEPIDINQQNPAVQAALAQRQAMINGVQNAQIGQAEKGIFKVRPKPAPK